MLSALSITAEPTSRTEQISRDCVMLPCDVAGAAVGKDEVGGGAHYLLKAAIFLDSCFPVLLLVRGFTTPLCFRDGPRMTLVKLFKIFRIRL